MYAIERHVVNECQSARGESLVTNLIPTVFNAVNIRVVFNSVASLQLYIKILLLCSQLTVT